MTHRVVREWGHVPIGASGFSRLEAHSLHAAACEHPLAYDDATNILVLRHDRLVARQMVGIVAARESTLEILPKIDSDKKEVDVDGVRQRLVRMLDVALGLQLAAGSDASVARQDTTLLEILIDAFAQKLLSQVRKGLPRAYALCNDDLPAMRGRLDVVRQFTRNAVRPDRLACIFDQLEIDTPLMRVMAAATAFLRRHARTHDVQRKLDELRYVFSEVPIVPVARLPWKQVRIDRSNRSWASLFRLAELLLRRNWETTYHAAKAPAGMTLLFPMNDLFEKYIAALLRKALNGSGIDVIDQGGHRACLGQFRDGQPAVGDVFRTKPDILLRRGHQDLAIIDTKWKMLQSGTSDRKLGVSQSDVYQLMAYARLYSVNELMLLYPFHAGIEQEQSRVWGMSGGYERLEIATVDISRPEQEIMAALKVLFGRHSTLKNVAA